MFFDGFKFSIPFLYYNIRLNIKKYFANEVAPFINRSSIRLSILFLTKIGTVIFSNKIVNRFINNYYATQYLYASVSHFSFGKRSV